MTIDLKIQLKWTKSLKSQCTKTETITNRKPEKYIIDKNFNL